MSIETRYAKSGDINIAYQVLGKGGPDLVLVMGWVSHLDYFWQEPRFANFLTRLASFSRLIVFDKRGTGLSDRVAGPATLEQRMDDVRAVMDAVGSERAALVGISEGGPMCALFAATYPSRTSALITFGGFPRRTRTHDFPWGPSVEEREGYLRQVEKDWGGPVGLALRAPSLAGDRQFRDWWATYLRMSASPGAAVALSRMNMEIDIRHVLPTIRVPTLILHRGGDLLIPVEVARYMARQIPHARYVEFPGEDHLPFAGDQEPVLREIERFLEPVVRPDEPDTVLTTVLAVEIVEAASLAARMGEQLWRGTVASFGAAIRRELAQFRGRGIRTNEVGFLAVFDGPARAARCARSVLAEARRLGVTARAGLHTGECSVAGGDYAGIPLLAATKIMEQAQPNEVLASSTVKDLVAGSGLQFAEVGVRPLGEWRLYRQMEDNRPASSSTPPSAPLSPSLRHAHLSPREQEVAALLALGLANQEIADQLVLSIGTVERHVANIFTKLGFHSRAQVAAWAAQSGLLRGE